MLIPAIVNDEITGVSHCGGSDLDGEKLSKLIKRPVDTLSWMYLFIEIRKNSADVCYYYRKYTMCLSRFQNVLKHLTKLEAEFQKPLDSQNLRGEVETLENLGRAKRELREEAEFGLRMRKNLCDIVGADAVDRIDKQLKYPALAVVPLFEQRANSKP